MYFLAVDTATNCGGVALGRNAELIGLLMVKAPLRYSESVLRFIEALLGEFELRPSDIGCLVAAHGPGSFTGLRIGLATVKGFGQSLNLPAVGVSTLEALAYRFRHVASRVAPMVDARRQQVFGAVYEVKEGGESRPAAPESVAPPAEWLRSLAPEPHLFVGDAAQMYAPMLASLRPGDRVLRSDNGILPELLLLGYHRFLRGETEPASRLTAHYLRPSDAEVAG